MSFLNIFKNVIITNRFSNLRFNLKLDVVRINSIACLTENQTCRHAGLFSLGCISHGFFSVQCSGGLSDRVAAARWSFSLSQFCCWGLLAD